MNIDNFVKSIIEIEMQKQVEKAKNEVSKRAVASSYHIEIHNDGKTTECMLFYNDNLVRKTVAKCSPEDKFNLSTGAKIALERMFPSKVKNVQNVQNVQKEGSHKCPKTKRTEVKEETPKTSSVRIVRIRLANK